MSTDDRLTMALFRLEEDITARRAPREVEPIVIPWTVDRAIATFLNRWHWRGERTVVERELRSLISDAKAQG